MSTTQPTTSGPFSGAVTKVANALDSADMSVRARCSAAADVDYADLVTMRGRIALCQAEGTLAFDSAVQLQAIAAHFDECSLAERIVFIQTLAILLAEGGAR